MGMGDVKLAGLVGLVLGALGGQSSSWRPGWGSSSGERRAAIVALVFGASRRPEYPFGPSIALGAVVARWRGTSSRTRT